MNFLDEYIKNYDMTIPEIAYKYYHSRRVMDNMIVLAKSINLPYDDIKLAKYIGLLHDIGRFEQFRKYHSFSDQNIDHGDLGETILRDMHALTNFDISKEDYDIVYTAIRNHNKYMIEAGLDKRTLIFAKMIRDADKLDILYALNNKDIKSVIWEDNSEISDRVKNQFLANSSVKNDGTETKNEKIITMFSFIYDFNYYASIEILKNEDYYGKIYRRLKNKALFKPYIEHVKEYIDERTDSCVR